jgi:hypothetical protein
MAVYQLGGGGASFNPQPRTWENAEWLTLSTGAGAPSSSSGGSGWFYFDTTGEDLYGPAAFDGGIPGWDWGTPLANVVFSATGPTDEAGDWYVWDENGDGSLYTLFQKKTATNHDDIIRSQSGSSWESVSPKVSILDIYHDMRELEPVFGVMNGNQMIGNLYTFSAQTWGGYWSDKIVEEISGTYEVQAGYANNFFLTLTDDTTLNLPTDMNASVGYSDALANKSSEISVLIKQGGEGNHTLTWGSMILEPSGGLTLSSNAEYVDWFKLITVDNGTTWYLSRVGQGYQP